MEYITNENVNSKFQSRLKKFMNCITSIKIIYSKDFDCFYFLFLNGKNVVIVTHSISEINREIRSNHLGGKT